MGIYLEALILYFVLFFSGAVLSNVKAAEAAGFSAAVEITRIFFYNIPSLVLIWYLLIRVKPIKNWDIKPGKKDAVCALVTFPCLLVTGFVISYISSYTGGTSSEVLLHSPCTFVEWVVLCFSILTAAYLEESFFRFYLLARRDELKLSALPALIFSTALFSICHVYEGPWGFLNAVLSGTLLCFMFLRYRSLHGISIAHALYNLAVYIINTLSIQT